MKKLERAGVEHKLIYYDSSGKHDSITIRGSKWFDHKNQTGGGAIKFMQEFYGMDFQTVGEPLGQRELLGQRVTSAVPQSAESVSQRKKRKSSDCPKQTQICTECMLTS